MNPAEDAKMVANKGYGAREITDLILFCLLISFFPLKIVLEDADTFLMPQGYVKLNIPNLSRSSLQCKGNNYNFLSRIKYNS